MDKKYKVHIVIGHQVVYTVEVSAFDEDSAREFAYDMFEHDSVAMIDGVDINVKKTV